MKPKNKKNKSNRTNILNLGFRWLGKMLSQLFSSFRFSLTLRIAVHSCLEIIRTALMIVLIFTIVYCVAQMPMIYRTFDMLDTTIPANGNIYGQEQFVDSRILQAYFVQTPYTGDFNGYFERVKMTLGSIYDSKVTRLQLYHISGNRGMMVVFDLTDWLHIYLICLIGLAAMDLYRIFYVLRHRSSLNKQVLKPIADMTKAAENLSANNLSDRINLAGTKNEFKDLAAVINGMLDRIERSYNSQKQFVSDASHELRTPIAVIQGYANMLERWGKTDTSVLDEGITAISQETASMKELVERLLFLARHDKKTLLLEMEIFDPAEIMFTVFRDAQLLSATHKFNLTADVHCLINGDKGMLKQLLRILVDNAIKYTPSDGKINLALQAENNECIISIQDNGQGISKEDMTRIFDRFYRSDKARKAESGGHGLGLSIARIIVAAHSGTITVRSKENAGTTFFVRLPLAAENV